MGVLSLVIEPLVLVMLQTVEDHLLGCAVALKESDNNHARHLALPLEQLEEELFDGFLSG